MLPPRRSDNVPWFPGIGYWTYMARFNAESAARRTLLYNEEFGKRFGTISGDSDSESREAWRLRSFVTIDERLKLIRERIPSITTDIKPGSNTEKFTEYDYQEYAEDRRRHKVKPF